ncbi:hypothetical protein FA95DRAFT_342653 [Auriscalpium vulgare]|uniref:Uncharacterized protein n=1 Tax=Auriscalpium vulgare TaxID=40419 RepID=A0ACB8RI01_9AGAM|nr:hypothetical protein FA95DRAFT_342653 [Auriscalpium vulgare]
MIVMAMCRIGSARDLTFIRLPENDATVHKVRDFVLQTYSVEVGRISAGWTDIKVLVVPLGQRLPKEPRATLEDRVDELINSGKLMPQHSDVDLSEIYEGQEPNMHKKFVQVIVNVTTPGASCLSTVFKREVRLKRLVIRCQSIHGPLVADTKCVTSGIHCGGTYLRPRISKIRRNSRLFSVTEPRRSGPRVCIFSE